MFDVNIFSNDRDIKKCQSFHNTDSNDADNNSMVNRFPHSDTFWRPWETILLKTLREKEKLLVTSNFSFSHSVFYPFG